MSKTIRVLILATVLVFGLLLSAVIIEAVIAKQQLRNGMLAPAVSRGPNE